MQITTVDEAKTFYPLFGLGANVALIFSGRAVKYFSQVCHATFFGAQLICRVAAHARLLLKAVHGTEASRAA